MRIQRIVGVLAFVALSVVAEQNPNVVYILLDDAGWGDLSCYGQKKFETPHVDQLAAEGMRFTQHYSGSTVCAPTRCSLMTGLHTGHCSVRGNGEHKPHGQEPMSADEVTVAELLKKAGYATGCFGKWGLGYVGSHGDPLAKGFDEFFGYNCQRWAHDFYRPWLDHNRERVETKGEYSAKLIGDRALDFVRRNKENPFFLYYAMTIPHAQMQVPDEYYNRFKDRYPELKEDDPVKRRQVLAFPAMMTYMDDQVGALMELLKELNLDENTIVLFASDNGPHREGGHRPEFWNSSGPFSGIKRDLYEGGIRCPFIVRWPGKVEPGTTNDLISAHWDVLPTVCEIAEIAPPTNIDGISMLPTLTGKGTQREHKYLYWEFYEGGGKQAVRMGKWKAVRNNINKVPNAPIELYDVTLDPAEKNNVAQQHPETVQKVELYFSEAHEDSPVWKFTPPQKRK